jgi:hypothetical protein
MNVAFAREAGKPFIVSEFNQPWPNQQSSDLLPVVTQFAISQDWDGLVLYTYAHDNDIHGNTPSDFSLDADWTKITQFAQCARYFKQLMPDTTLPVINVKVSHSERIRAATKSISGNLVGYLSSRQISYPTIPLANQVQISASANSDIGLSRGGRTTSYLAFDDNSQLIKFGSAYASGLTGYLGIANTVHSANFDLTLLPPGRGFATAFLTSLDGTPLLSSSWLLLSLPGLTMGTSEGNPQGLTSTDISNKWFTIAPEVEGEISANLHNVPGPPQMERIPAKITLRLGKGHITVFALDLDGKRLASIPVKKEAEDSIFYVNTDAQIFAPAYEILRARD